MKQLEQQLTRITRKKEFRAEGRRRLRTAARTSQWALRGLPQLGSVRRTRSDFETQSSAVTAPVSRAPCLSSTVTMFFLSLSDSQVMRIRMHQHGPVTERNPPRDSRSPPWVLCSPSFCSLPSQTRPVSTRAMRLLRSLSLRAEPLTLSTRMCFVLPCREFDRDTRTTPKCILRMYSNAPRTGASSLHPCGTLLEVPY